MKTLRLISMFFICAALSAGVASCGGGDDNEDPKPVNPVSPGNEGNTGGDNNVSGIQVQTGNSSDVTGNSALLSGSFYSTRSHPDMVGFLIGKSSNLTSTNRDRDLTIFDIVSPFSAAVDGLQPQTTYYYRAYAYTAQDGNYYYGEIRSFTTNEGNDSGGNTSGAKGNGTLSNPYNVAAISAIASRLRAGEIDATDYYFKGMVSEISSKFHISGADSTATFYISDGNGVNKFLCNKISYLHNEGYWGGKNITIGDEVIICGKVTNSGSELGTSSGRAYVYSINGDTGKTDAIEYSIGGRTFRTVLVEGGPMKPFYIMQTELPLYMDMIILNRVIPGPDLNGDGKLIKTELRAFLEDLRKLTGYRFRLATEEEWQYAARGGNKSKGYTYSGSNNIEDVAWYSGNSNNQLHGLALKKANELGLYDMSGNYAELCAIISSDGSNDNMSLSGRMYGGSWKDAASACTVSSWQKGSSKNNQTVDDAYKYVALRLVYTKW